MLEKANPASAYHLKDLSKLAEKAEQLDSAEIASKRFLKILADDIKILDSARIPVKAKFFSF